MSADNYAVIKPHPNGGFTYVIAFASDPDPDLTVYPTDSQFDTLQDAVQAARDEQTEYGYSVDDECWTSNSPIARALELGPDDGFDLPSLTPELPRWKNPPDAFALLAGIDIVHADEPVVLDELAGLRQRPQRQDALNDQLRTLYHAANRLGCYDAADFIWRHVSAGF